MIRKLILCFIAGLSAVLAVGQTANSPVHQSIWNNPNIYIPASSMPRAHGISTHYVVVKNPGLMPNGVLHPAAGPAGYWPKDIHAAYKIPSNLGTNAIAVVGAFDNPTALTDFQTFSNQFGLPTETSSNPTSSSNKHFQVVYAQGSQPQTDAGWAGETSLDIEWTHAMAPNAKIFLVEANDNGFSNLYGAVTVAHGLPNVKIVSMSWGGDEDSSELSQDQTFNVSGVVFFASSGDIGGAQSYPAESPYVVGVGGTHLVLDSQDNVIEETAWSDAGGGPSAFEPRPAYQNGISNIIGAVRGCPDISAVADPDTGVAVFSQTGGGGWIVVGGTSVSCPVCAGIANARGQFSKTTTEELQRIYATYANQTLWPKLYRDVTTGTAGSFTAAVGWDFITGIGVPINLYPNPNGISFTPINPQLITGTEVNGSPYNLNSVFTAPMGQAAAMSVDFTVNQDPTTFASLSITASLTSALRSTSQVFIWNNSTQKYEVLVSGAGTGSPGSLTKDISTYLLKYTFMVGGNKTLRFAMRSVAPARTAAAPYNFQVGTISLSGFLNS